LLAGTCAELLQDDATPENLGMAVERYLSRPQYAREVLKALKRWRYACAVMPVSRRRARCWRYSDASGSGDGEAVSTEADYAALEANAG